MKSQRNDNSFNGNQTPKGERKSWTGARGCIAIELKDIGENVNKVLILLNEMQLEYIRLPGAKYQPQFKKGKKKKPDLKKMGVVENWNSGLEHPEEQMAQKNKIPRYKGKDKRSGS